MFRMMSIGRMRSHIRTAPTIAETNRRRMKTAAGEPPRKRSRAGCGLACRGLP